MNFLLHCVEWIRNLSDRQQIYVDIHVGDFKFVFENKHPGSKQRTPSQLKRDFSRRKDLKPNVIECKHANDTTFVSNNNIEFDDCLVNEEQTVEKSSNQEVKSKIQYDLMVEADSNIKNYDIVEAIEVNYDGALDERDVDKDDPCRFINIYRLDQCEQDMKKNCYMYRIHVENSATSSSVIEDWKQQNNFDDLAFGNAIRDKLQVRIREVKRFV